MANTVLTPDIIAKEAVMILENELVMAPKVYRGLESEFSNKVNGYEVGDTVSIRRPTDFTVRSGATASNQDVVEGKTSITVDQQKGVDFAFTSAELTLDISELSDRVIRPAMIQLANDVDQSLMSLYSSVPNWVGTPGQTINSFADYSKAPERMDEFANPVANRCGVLAPADFWAMAGTQTGLFVSDVAKGAYRKGNLGELAGVETYKAQNTPTHTVGVATGTPVVNGASQDTTWAATKDTNTQSLVTDGWTNSTTGILKKGDVFTIAGVYAVNPVTKATLTFLKQFVVTADANSGASTGPATLTISPPMIASGAQQTVSAAPADNAAITVLGASGASYRQNMVFCRDAFALAMVPMALPQAAVKPSRQTYKGTSVRVTPYYDGTNDKSNWRLDILYGVKAIDPRLAVRVSGTA